MELENVEEILNWPTPKNVFEVKSFNGLVSFYMKFTKNFSGICAPIVETIKRIINPSIGL